jgi:hypothetical protein
MALWFSKFKGREAKSGAIYADRDKRRDAGYIAIVELGARNTNLHLHAVVFGPLVPIKALRTSWEKITGDSFGVHRTGSLSGAVDPV